MSRAKAASRAAASNVAASLAALLSPARAEASRKNGAKSRGPVTPEGKARASRNALTHGLCAGQHVVVEGESPEAFAAFEAALVADLAPAGALQTLLAGRIARAAWRLERAERIEAELFAREMDGPFGEGDLGLALIRDGNGARAFDTLLRYRGTALAELWRALRLLKALQAEQAHGPEARKAAPAPHAALPQNPIEPEARGNPGEIAHAAAADKPEAPCRCAERRSDPAAAAAAVVLPPRPATDPRARGGKPIEPEVRRTPGENRSSAGRRRAERATRMPCIEAPAMRQAGAEDSGGTSWRPNWRSAAKPRVRSSAASGRRC
jgi:hypothetical protein